MKKFLLSLALLCISQISHAQLTPSMKSSFAPTGIVRVGINLGNPILANENPTTHQAQGVSVDIAREISRQTGLPIKLIPFKTAGNTVDALRAGELDLIFVAIDPVRGADISYTPAYIQIEGAYMVKARSPITSNEQVDAAGNEIVVGKGSAYDLFLTREIQRATILRVSSSQAVVDDFMSGKGTVAAGVKQQLENDAKRYQGLRLLPGRFMAINQAIGIPKSRPQYEQANAYLSNLIVQLKQSGFIAQAMQSHQIKGAKVAE